MSTKKSTAAPNCSEKAEQFKPQWERENFYYNTKWIQIQILQFFFLEKLAEIKKMHNTLTEKQQLNTSAPTILLRDLGKNVLNLRIHW